MDAIKCALVGKIFPSVVAVNTCFVCKVTRDVLVLLNYVPILVHLYCFSHSITMEV